MYKLPWYQVTFGHLQAVNHRHPIYIAKISQKYRVGGLGHIFDIYLSVIDFFVYMGSRRLVLDTVKVWTHWDVFLTYLDVKIET